MTIAILPTRSERTRAQIVESASRLFWLRNYHGVSIDEVAEAAKVNKATVYRYFADKRDLALAVVRHNGEVTIQSFFATSFAAHQAPGERLAAIFRRAHGVHADLAKETGDDPGCPIVGLALELGQEMPEIRIEAQRVFDQIERYFVAIAIDAIATRGLDADPGALGRTLTQLLHGAFVSARLARDPARILDAREAALAMIGFPGKPLFPMKDVPL